MVMLTFTTYKNLWQVEASNEAVAQGLAGPYNPSLAVGLQSQRPPSECHHVSEGIWESVDSVCGQIGVFWCKNDRDHLLLLSSKLLSILHSCVILCWLLSAPFTLMGTAWINNATNPTVFISAPSLLLFLFQSFKAPLSRIKDWRGAEAPRVTATVQTQRRFSSFLTKKLKKQLSWRPFRSHCFDSR